MATTLQIPGLPIDIIRDMREVGKYRLGPFLIGSELEIPELEERRDPAEPDVLIRVGPVPERIENVVAHETRWWASREEYLQRVPGVANFLVRCGREIIIEPSPDSIAGDIRAYLLAPIFSSLCFQAGMYALHGSAIRTPRGVVAFLGHSGAGKSTLAALLERHGFPVISDDLCLLERSIADGGLPTIIPVAPALKLWPSALEHLGASSVGLPQVWSQERKYRLRLRELDGRYPLVEVIFLEWSEALEDAPTLSRVQGVEAITSLMSYTHFEYILKAVGRQAECFRVSAEILRTARAMRLRRPKEFSRLQEVTELLLAHLQ